MSIGNESEEEPLNHSELAALAEERDRQDKLAGKARGGANQARGKRREVSEKDLLAHKDAKKVWRVFSDRRWQASRGAWDITPRKAWDIIFGPEDKTRFVFSRAKGRSKGAAKRKVARWTVSLAPVTISGYDIDRERSKYGRGLGEKDAGSLAFKAAEQLLACHVEIERLRKLQLLHHRLQQCLLWRLREKAKQEGVALIEPDAAAQETAYTYPKPLVDTLRELREQLARVEEQLATQIVSLIRARDAISLTIEALSKGDGGKLQIAFDLLWDNSQWLQEVTNLRFHAVALAAELQRPPTKAELRERYNSKRSSPLEESKFSPLLKDAGLSWLEKRARGPNTHG